jgi:L-alanine-DL-glutamate epimerase-like enolase superfamily enzyme
VRITGYRVLSTSIDRGRRIGDVNGVYPTTLSAVSILLVDTDDGVTGVAAGGTTLIERVWPAIEGEDPRSVTALYDRMLAHAFKTGHAGQVFATIGALDTALWDIKAKAADEPLWRLLGGRDRRVPGYASGLDFGLTDDELFTLYAAFAERGFTAAKLKGGLNLDDDLRRFGIIRDALAVAHPVLMLDANECWNPKQAVRYLRRLEESVDLAWIEEPVRRWDTEGLAIVGRSVRAAVATGENLSGLEQFRPLIAGHALDIAQPGSGWGVTYALRVAGLANGHDLLVSPVGFVAGPAAAVMAAVPNHVISEVQGLTYPDGLLVDQEFADGAFLLGDNPGNGFSVDESALELPEPGIPTDEGPDVRPPDAGRRLGLYG